MGYEVAATGTGETAIYPPTLVKMPKFSKCRACSKLLCFERCLHYGGAYGKAFQSTALDDPESLSIRREGGDHHRIRIFQDAQSCATQPSELQSDLWLATLLQSVGSRGMHRAFTCSSVFGCWPASTATSLMLWGRNSRIRLPKGPDVSLYALLGD